MASVRTDPAPAGSSAVPAPPPGAASGTFPPGGVPDGDGARQVARSLRLTGPGRVAGRALQFVLQLVLGRVLGPGAYGIYSLAFSIVEVVKQFGLLGMQNGVVRIGAMHLADGDTAAVRGCARASYRTALLSSVLLAAALWFTAEPLAARALKQPELLWPLRVFALSMPFDAWLILTAFWSRALRRVHIDVILADLAQPGLSIVAVGVALALGTGVVGAAAGFGVASLLGAALGLVLLGRSLPHAEPHAAPARYDVRPLLRTSIPMLLVGFSYILMGHVDKVMIGAMVGAEAVGVYTAAFRMSRQIGLIQTAFVPMFAPLVSGLHHRKSHAELERLYQQASHWILAASLPVVLILIVFGDLPLMLFGQRFIAAWPILVILAAGQFINLAGGLAMQVLQMVGRQDDDLAIISGGLVLNIVLNLWLVRTQGAIGAAIATTIAFAALSGARLLAVRLRVGLWPYTRHSLRLVVVGVIAGLAGAAVRGTEGDVVWGLTTAAITLAVYGGGAWCFALRESDRVLVRQALWRLRGGAR
jgi:O-antigen/teichoic acid export membrane protein